jgi:hypothetical protein
MNTAMPIRPISEIKNKILSSSRVLKAIEYEVEQRREKTGCGSEKLRATVRAEAEGLIATLVA